MKSIFVDTNIIIDLLGDRKPYSKFATTLFDKAESNQVRLFTSSHAIATTYYVLKKNRDDKQLRRILLTLLDFINIIAIDIHVLKRGLTSKYKGFEDSLQIFAALSAPKIDYIVTRNIKDFKGSEIPVYPPDIIVNKL